MDNYNDHNVSNMTEDELTNHISSKTDTETKPMLYRISAKTAISKYDNTLPIQRKIYDLAMLEMYELFVKAKAINPNCKKQASKQTVSPLIMHLI